MRFVQMEHHELGKVFGAGEEGPQSLLQGYLTVPPAGEALGAEQAFNAPLSWQSLHNACPAQLDTGAWLS